MVNSVDPDGMAHYEPSHQDLYFLQKRYMGLQTKWVKFLRVKILTFLGSL